jgi:hypothetical protein
LSSTSRDGKRLTHVAKRSIAKRLPAKGRWLKHEELRVLGENNRVIRPPLIYVDAGERYSFDGKG